MTALVHLENKQQTTLEVWNYHYYYQYSTNKKNINNNNHFWLTIMGIYLCMYWRRYLCYFYLGIWVNRILVKSLPRYIRHFVFLLIVNVYGNKNVFKNFYHFLFSLISFFFFFFTYRQTDYRTSSTFCINLNSLAIPLYIRK